MIKVFFDNQIFSAQKFGGISRYIVELKTRLPEYDVCVNNTKIFSENIYLKNKYSLPGNFKIPFKNYLIRQANNVLDRADFSSEKYDIFHPTYYHSSKYFESVKSKKVITVHDMIHETFREDILESADVMPAKKRIIQSADHIIAISEHTKKDIIKYLGIPEEKISVVYHGAAATRGELKPLSLPTTYILFVGSRSGYKSFDKFIRFSCETLIKNNVSVFCAGGGPFTSAEKLLIQQLGLPHLVFQKNVSDEELNYCYKHARLFIFPSIYEGFGLPILEAFACHCPVLLFNGSCFPEIARDSAYYFDNFEDLPELLSKMLIDDVFRNKKIQMQNLRLLDFSWNNTAQQTSSVYKNIL